jgi:DNA-binding MarR family transcriptional regulator
MEHQLENDVVSLQHILMQLSFASRRRLAEDVNIFNLTVPQFSALSSLARHPEGISMSEVANACHQVSATMTGIIDRLSDRGLVRRQQAQEDRRTQLVFLTQEGAVIISEIETRQIERMSRVLQRLTGEERAEMLRLMTIYLETIQGDTDTPAS